MSDETAEKREKKHAKKSGSKERPEAMPKEKRAAKAAEKERPKEKPAKKASKETDSPDADAKERHNPKREELAKETQDYCNEFSAILKDHTENSTYNSVRKETLYTDAVAFLDLVYRSPPERASHLIKFKEARLCKWISILTETYEQRMSAMQDEVKQYGAEREILVMESFKNISRLVKEALEFISDLKQLQSDGSRYDVIGRQATYEKCNQFLINTIIKEQWKIITHMFASEYHMYAISHGIKSKHGAGELYSLGELYITF